MPESLLPPSATDMSIAAFKARASAPRFDSKNPAPTRLVAHPTRGYMHSAAQSTSDTKSKTSDKAFKAMDSYLRS